MNRLTRPFRCLLLALAWLLLSPVQPHLHAHALGAGSADAVTGLHSPWAHDMPGPSDSEFIAEVEDARKLVMSLLPQPVAVVWRNAAIARPQPVLRDPPEPCTPPPRTFSLHPQAP